MRDLYKSIPIPKVYSQYGSDIMVLPLSLTDYYNLWWNDDGPNNAEKFYLEKHIKNKITGEKTTWLSPPKDQFKTFMGRKCQSQRDRKWRVFWNAQYPDVA